MDGWICLVHEGRKGGREGRVGNVNDCGAEVCMYVCVMDGSIYLILSE